jgi:hypothetical protein
MADGLLADVVEDAGERDSGRVDRPVEALAVPCRRASASSAALTFSRWNRVALVISVIGVPARRSSIARPTAESSSLNRGYAVGSPSPEKATSATRQNGSGVPAARARTTSAPDTAASSIAASSARSRASSTASCAAGAVRSTWQ